MKKYFPLILLTILFLSLYSSNLFRSTQKDTYYREDLSSFISFKSDVSGSNGMVSSASSYATEVGVEILKHGGNAVDAAVAVGFVLAVTHPQAGNIGGGGFMMIRTKDSVITALDFREKAPINSTRDMFLDENGKFLPDKSQVGHLSSGTPGSVSGLLYALEKYGTLPREAVMKKAIELARDGFRIQKHLAASLNSHREEFSQFSSTKKVFTKQSGFTEGDLFVQKDLAQTLEIIKDKGKDGFYDGVVAELIEKEMLSNGGLISKSDLRAYRTIERKPVTTNYKGFDIYSMPPPSSGGILLINLLNMIENDDVPDTSNNNALANYYYIMIESMKRAYADRSEYLGDPDFYSVPVDMLISKEYAEFRRNQIGISIVKSIDIKPGLAEYKESEQTTHYSVIDKDGNMVAVTTTLNNVYGSYVVVDGAGFFMNDEMDDFASKPGEPNMFGLVGSEANSIQPGKRMLSSMTPTLILRNNEPFMILGSPGGGRIITTVFRTILNVIDFGLPLDYAVDKPRFHHQWLPDKLQTEYNALSDRERELLTSLGYEIETINDYGSVDAVMIDWKNKIYYGHSDRRANGLAAGY